MPVQLKHVPIENLTRGAYQPRRDFDELALQELAASIKSQGIIEPLIVRSVTKDQYEIIAGERRWRAAQIAKLSEVPCLVGDYTNQQAAAVSLIENIQRQDLNILEEAAGFKRLMDTFHFQQEEIATLIGKSRSHIANSIRLLSLDEKVQNFLLKQLISSGHARVLIGLSPAEQIYFSENIIAQGWSVRKTEKEVQAQKASVIQPSVSHVSQDIKNLEFHLSEQLGAPVEISTNPSSGGWVKIKFYDNDTLSGILEQLGLTQE